jgi:hypothetical protein
MFVVGGKIIGLAVYGLSNKAENVGKKTFVYKLHGKDMNVVGVKTTVISLQQLTV